MIKKLLLGSFLSLISVIGFSNSAYIGHYGVLQDSVYNDLYQLQINRIGNLGLSDYYYYNFYGSDVPNRDAYCGGFVLCFSNKNFNKSMGILFFLYMLLLCVSVGFFLLILKKMLG